jgi:hypothetical protein
VFGLFAVQTAGERDLFPEIETLLKFQVRRL